MTAPPPPPKAMANSPVCPLSLSRWARWPASIAESITANSWERVPFSESIAPARIRLSIMRRFTALRSTRSQKL